MHSLSSPRLVSPTRLGAALLLTMLAVPAAWSQTLAPGKSSIGFAIKQMGVPVEGRFKQFDAKLVFDPKKPEAGSVNFTIDLGSAEIGDAETTKELGKPEWFNTAKFPAATFSSTAIKANGPGKLDVTGKLAIKGQVRDVTVPVALAQSGTDTVASGKFTLKRVEFKIGEGEWADTSIVANDVSVSFKLSFAGIGPLQ